VSNLEQFRAQTRARLEENCPHSMRTPVKAFDDFYSGGRKPINLKLIKTALQLRENGLSIDAIAGQLKIGRSTLYRELGRR
jgi:hypothetical protein